MKNISLFTCSAIALIVVLSACAQSTVTVRPTQSTNKTQAAKTTVPRKQYKPISLNAPYIVQAGDTLYGISFRAGLSYRELAVWNNISEPYTVKIGQRILLRSSDVEPPLNVGAIAASSTATNVGKPLETKHADARPPLIKPTTAGPRITVSSVTPISKPGVSVTPVANASEKPVPASEIKPVDIAGAMSWRWPSEGTLIARYVQGDTAQQGINIGGKSGQPIHASADGTVVYSGAGLVGYGELIIIKHNTEWLSAYAHNRRRLVAEGTKIKAGDVIAEMGRTGTMRDMLHFEIRRNGKPVDPLMYLPKQ